MIRASDKPEPGATTHDRGGNQLDRRADHPRRNNTWRIERIDTEALTGPQRDNAINALAALINHWGARASNYNDADAA